MKPKPETRGEKFRREMGLDLKSKPVSLSDISDAISTFAKTRKPTK